MSRCVKLKLKLNYLHKHKAAKRRTDISGGWQSGKNGLAAYCANVNAMIACIQKKRVGLTVFATLVCIAEGS